MCVLCVYYIMYIGVAPTKATAEGESVRMKMKKKGHTARERLRRLGY